VGADGPDVDSERQISTEKFVFINRKREKIIKTGISMLCILALSSTFSIAHDRRPFTNYEFLNCFFPCRGHPAVFIKLKVTKIVSGFSQHTAIYYFILS
jgi:hypothetical protein